MLLTCGAVHVPTGLKIWVAAAEEVLAEDSFLTFTPSTPGL